MALGALFFVAAMSMYGSHLFLHGNPIGIRCVFACTGLIIGLPVGGLCYQAYSRYKENISAAFVLNAWLGLLVPIVLSDLVLGVTVTLSHLLKVSHSAFLACVWGITHIFILILMVLIMQGKEEAVLARSCPRLYETIRMVEEVLAPSTRRILDLRFLLRHQILALASTGFLEGTWILPAATVVKLRHWSISSSPRMKHRAQRALANVNFLQHAYPSKLIVSCQHVPLDWGPTKAMWMELIRGGTRILCTRSRIAAYAKSPLFCSIKDETSLVLPLWVRALQSPYQSGDWLELSILGRGRQPLQARSQLEDGTLVFIAQGAPYVGQRVRVQVVRVLHSVTGFLIFATLG